MFTPMYSPRSTAPPKKEVSTCKDKKQLWSSMRENPANYETIRKKTNIYEQTPVNIDDFKEFEEAEVKQQVEKKRMIAEKNKLLKKRAKD